MYKYGASSILEDSESRNLFLLITRLSQGDTVPARVQHHKYGSGATKTAGSACRHRRHVKLR